MKKILIAIFVLIVSFANTVYGDSKPLVSVLVSGKDHSHLAETLSEVKRLGKKVDIVNVAIALPGEDVLDLSELENSNAISQNTATPSSLDSRVDLKSLEELDLTRTNITFDDSLIRRLRLNYSPTWIVRYKGNDYVFEGYRSISKYFTRSGEFEY